MRPFVPMKSWRYGHNQVIRTHAARLAGAARRDPQILDKMGVDQNAIRERLDSAARQPGAIYGGGAGQVLSPRVKRVVDVANEEANQPGRLHRHGASFSRS